MSKFVFASRDESRNFFRKSTSGIWLQFLLGGMSKQGIMSWVWCTFTCSVAAKRRKAYALFGMVILRARVCVKG